MTISRLEAGAFACALSANWAAWGASLDVQHMSNKWYLVDWPIGDPSAPVPAALEKYYLKFTQMPDYKPASDMLDMMGNEAKARAEARARAEYQVPRAGTNLSKSFMEEFNRLTTPTKSAYERLEFLRRGAPEPELQQAVRAAFKSAERELRHAGADPVTAMLENPDVRFFWEGMGRIASGRPYGEFAEMTKALRQFKSLDDGATLANALFPIPVSTDVYDLLLTYGAFRSLGVRPMPSTKTKFAKLTGLPATYFITPTSSDIGRTIPADGALSGTSLSQQANLVVALIEASQEVLQDEKVDLADVLLRAFLQGVAGRIDYACFQGAGVDDSNDGAQTGIFIDETVAAVSAASGHQSIEGLYRDDFLAVVAALTPAALQRPCRWFINPGHIPALLRLVDERARSYLLRTPAETGGEWYLVGFPVTFAAQAPIEAIAGSKVAAFGEPQSFLVGIREDFEMGVGDGAKWNQNIRQLRCIARARADMREATGWATLKLAANAG